MIMKRRHIPVIDGELGSKIKRKEDSMKNEGYDSRLDESLGMKNKGKKSQSLKSRRDESKAMEKARGRKAYSSVKSMDKGARKMGMPTKKGK